jgi:hypothetical protein
MLYSSLNLAADQISAAPDSWILTCPTGSIAQMISQVLWCMRLGWSIFYAIHLSRFFFQIFGNINIFNSDFLRFIFQLSRFSNRLFIGILPCINGIDLGTFLTLFLFERFDQFLKQIVIYDQFFNTYT